jgi:hypothetical protein
VARPTLFPVLYRESCASACILFGWRSRA